MIRAGIIGATGYAGGELARLLLGHPEAEIVWYGSRSYAGEPYASIYQNFFQITDAQCLEDKMEELASEADVIFNSALAYELGALKQQAVPLLAEVQYKYPEHSKALRLFR